MHGSGNRNGNILPWVVKCGWVPKRKRYATTIRASKCHFPAGFYSKPFPLGSPALHLHLFRLLLRLLLLTNGILSKDSGSVLLSAQDNKGVAALPCPKEVAIFMGNSWWQWTGNQPLHRRHLQLPRHVCCCDARPCPAVTKKQCHHQHRLHHCCCSWSKALIAAFGIASVGLPQALARPKVG